MHFAYGSKQRKILSEPMSLKHRKPFSTSSTADSAKALTYCGGATERQSKAENRASNVEHAANGLLLMKDF
jgi:hypothetical protein